MGRVIVCEYEWDGYMYRKEFTEDEWFLHGLVEAFGGVTPIHECLEVIRGARKGRVEEVTARGC